jgi:hypothetical protein
MSDLDMEKAKTADEPGTLASIREKHRQSRVFSGHPAELAGPIGGGDDELPEGRFVKPLEGEEPEGEPGPAKLPAKPPTEPKYKSIEEATKAQTEAERKMHEATTRTAELEKELAELKAKPPAAPAPTPEEIVAKVAEIMDEIDNLDPYADDYKQQRAQKMAEVATLRSTGGMDESTVAETVKRILDEERQADQAKRQQEAAEKASRDAAVTMAKEAGLKMDDPIVSRLFWDALSRAPYHEGVTLKEQVDYMVSEAREVVGKMAAEKGAASPEPAILERGSSAPIREPAKEEPPRTMGDIKEQWRERRRI